MVEEEVGARVFGNRPPLPDFGELSRAVLRERAGVRVSEFEISDSRFQIRKTLTPTLSRSTGRGGNPPTLTVVFDLLCFPLAFLASWRLGVHSSLFERKQIAIP
jgi:hypothetical protein